MLFQFQTQACRSFASLFLEPGERVAGTQRPLPFAAIGGCWHQGPRGVAPQRMPKADATEVAAKKSARHAKRIKSNSLETFEAEPLGYKPRRSPGRFCRAFRMGLSSDGAVILVVPTSAGILSAGKCAIGGRRKSSREARGGRAWLVRSLGPLYGRTARTESYGQNAASEDSSCIPFAFRSSDLLTKAQKLHSV